MLHILNDMLFFCLYAKRTASLRSLFCRKILLLQILNERIQKSFTDMSFGQPKNFGTSQGFIFVQQAILVGSNQDANRACNTQFHRRSNAPCTNFIHNQKIALWCNSSIDISTSCRRSRRAVSRRRVGFSWHSSLDFSK